jgi:hypothetical protein
MRRCLQLGSVGGEEEWWRGRAMGMAQDRVGGSGAVLRDGIVQGMIESEEVALRYWDRTCCGPRSAAAPPPPFLDAECLRRRVEISPFPSLVLGLGAKPQDDPSCLASTTKLHPFSDAVGPPRHLALAGSQRQCQAGKVSATRLKTFASPLQIGALSLISTPTLSQVNIERADSRSGTIASTDVSTADFLIFPSSSSVCGSATAQIPAADGRQSTYRSR